MQNKLFLILDYIVKFLSLIGVYYTFTYLVETYHSFYNDSEYDDFSYIKPSIGFLTITAIMYFLFSIDKNGDKLQKIFFVVSFYGLGTLGLNKYNINILGIFVFTCSSILLIIISYNRNKFNKNDI
ncbi:MAG: hypothetical protein CMO01_10585 [Thalassobius sp.]|nr:hypothetical protein [Thalassovita sp.]